MAHTFVASADFALDKPAGLPCPHLGENFRCDVHPRLRVEGFGGCVAYDCFGAGQQVSQVSFEGRDWRGDPVRAERMFAVFAVMRQVHELLWHLTEAARLTAAGSARADLLAAARESNRLAGLPPEELLRIDVDAHRRSVNTLLRRASELIRSGPGLPATPERAEHRGADLVGADLRGTLLVGADLRGALLVGADLRGADLTAADLTGADLRAADLRGADVSGALFLTLSQLEAARGDMATRVPPRYTRPGHWR